MLDSTASRQFMSRPDDERFPTTHELDDFVTMRRLKATESDVSLSSLRAVDDGGFGLILPHDNKIVRPTRHAFGQLCSAIQAPADYLRSLPDNLVSQNIDYSLKSAGTDNKLLIDWNDDGGTLRALTSKTYTRIWDNELSGLMRKVAEDHGWEVPTAFKRPDLSRNPVVTQDVTKADTTLYAGPEDCFLFLVDQTNPVQAGTLPNGEPRLFFRGVYSWNSETGTRTIGLATFLYEFVCCNRMIWGQAQFQKMARKHTKLAPEVFLTQMIPALEQFVRGDAYGIEQPILAAQAAKLRMDESQKYDYLYSMFNLSKDNAKLALDSVLEEEGHPAESAFDLIQGVTAFARSIPRAAERVDLETKVGDFLATFA